MADGILENGWDKRKRIRGATVQFRSLSAQIRGSAAQVHGRTAQIRGPASEHLSPGHPSSPDRDRTGIDALGASAERVVAGTMSAVPSFRISVSFSRDAVITKAERMLGRS
jgi:hypothetical protein